MKQRRRIYYSAAQQSEIAREIHTKTLHGECVTETR